MKIVYIAFSFIPSRTANSLHVMKMCQAFSKNGHEVYLLVPDNKEEYEKNITDIFEFYQVEPVFKVIKLPFLKLKGKILVFWLFLIYELVKIRPDLVYSRYVSGVFFASKLGFNCTFEAHNVIWDEASRDILHFNKLIQSKHFKYLVVISEKLKEAYLQKNLIDESKVIVAHDGADPAPPHSDLENWPGRKGVLQVGYVGHLYQGKGMEIVYAIAPALPNMDFHIIGGYDQDIVYWKSKIPHQNVHFHGFVSQDRLSAYLHQLDICLLPNQKKVNTHGLLKKDIGHYTSPLKMFDYMAHKKTIVASDLPVLREVLQHEKNAWLCPPAKPQAWIKSLDFLEKNEVLRTKLAECAWQDFMTHYTWKQRAIKVLS
ncbi:glycosyltransferase [Catalinimonas sp. 4WD22]|uniref:glycosyltransferase n=1 Tax=Catalinimonas locisalis TaxID=3133978 RepID=UPI00310147FE